MVFVGRHDPTIGRSNGRHKAENGSVGLWRRNTCHSVEAAERRTTHVAGATHNPIENIMELDLADASAPCPYGGQPPKNNVQTNTWERSSGGEESRFILPSYSPSSSGLISNSDYTMPPDQSRKCAVAQKSYFVLNGRMDRHRNRP
jgi:hypothetical protein